MESKHEIPDITRKPFECDSDYQARLIRSFHSLEAALKGFSERFCLNHAATLSGDRLKRSDGSCEMCALQSQLSEARSRLGPLADAPQVAGISGGRVMYVVGYPQDMKTVENALHDSFGILPAVRAALAEARSQIEALESSLTIERDAFRNMQLQRDALKAQLADYGKPVSERSAGE